MRNLKTEEKFCIDLTLNKHFKGFEEFMDDSRDKIYETMTNCFLELAKKDISSKAIIIIKATIQDKILKQN